MRPCLLTRNNISEGFYHTPKNWKKCIHDLPRCIMLLHWCMNLLHGLSSRLVRYMWHMSRMLQSLRIAICATRSRNFPCPRGIGNKLDHSFFFYGTLEAQFSSNIYAAVAVSEKCTSPSPPESSRSDSCHTLFVSVHKFSVTCCCSFTNLLSASLCHRSR